MKIGEISDLSQDYFVDEEGALVEHGFQEKEDNGSKSWVQGYKTVFWDLFLNALI